MSMKSSSRISSESVSLLEQLEQRLLLAAYAAGSYPTGINITESSTFGAGTFTLGAAITIAANSVTVTGAGQGVTIIEVDPTDTTGFNVFEIHNRNSIVIEDLTIDGNDGSLTWNPAWTVYLGLRWWSGFAVTNTSNSTIQNVTVHNMGENGLVWESGSSANNHILDSTFNFNGNLPIDGEDYHDGSGVWLTQNTGSSIERVYAEGNGYHGMGFGADNSLIDDSQAVNNSSNGFALNGATNSTIQNSTATGNTNGAGDVGDPGAPNQKNVIRNNILTGNKWHGIESNVFSPDPAFASIYENNTIDGTGATLPTGGGFYLSGGSNQIIRNNTITNVNWAGVYVNSTEGVRVEGNTISFTGNSGIIHDLDSSGGANSNNVTISGNTITNSGTNAFYAMGNSATGLVIDGNTIDTTVEYGIHTGFASRPGVVVTNNIVSNAGNNSGIFIQQNDDAIVIGNHLENNGIGLDGAERARIERNVVIGANDGITLNGTSWYSRVINNVVKNSVANGIYVNAMYNWVFGNRMSGSGAFAIRSIGSNNWTGNYGDENSGDTNLDWDDMGNIGSGLTYASGVVRFDFNADTFVNAADIDLLGVQKELATADPKWDMDGDSYVVDNVVPNVHPNDTSSDQADFNYLIEQIFQTGLGDADLDHDVDVNDLILWKANRFTSPTGWANGDFDGDADTDVNDLILWKSNRFTSYSSVVDLLA